MAQEYSSQIHSLIELLQSGKKSNKKKQPKNKNKNKNNNDEFCIAPFMCKKHNHNQDYHIKAKYQYAIIKPDENEPDVINADIYTAFIDNAKPHKKQTRRLERKSTSKRKTKRLK